MTFWGISVLIALISFPIVSNAQETAKPQANSYLVVDRDFVFQNSEIGQEISRRGEDLVDTLKAEDVRISGELLQEESDLAAMRADMDIESFAPLAKAFADKTERTREEFSVRTQDVSRTVAIWNRRFDGIISTASANIAQLYNVSMILNKDGMWWVDPNIDLSPSLVAVLDTQFKENPDTFINIIFAPIEDNTQNETGKRDPAAAVSTTPNEEPSQ